MVESREPFWAHDRIAATTRFRVYFLNDRGGIYALGYPVITVFGHLINLAELIFLARRAATRCCSSARRLFNALDVAHAGQRPRAAARDSLELLPQAACWRSWPPPSCRSSFSRSPRAPTSPPSSAPASKKRRRRPPPSRSGWSKTTRAAAARRRRRSTRSTTRSWCSSAGPSIRTSTCSTARASRRRASATCSPRGCCRRARRPRCIAGSCSTGCRRSSASRRSAACGTCVAAAPVRAGGPRRHRHGAA